VAPPAQAPRQRRSRKAPPATSDGKSKHVGFKADPETLTALDQLVTALAPRGVPRLRARSAVLRRILLEQAALLAKNAVGANK